MTDHIEFLLRMMAKIDQGLEGLWPRIQDDGSVGMMVNANDLFYWGTADGEMFEAGDELLLDECLCDLTMADPDYGDCYLLELFCCRKRGMRPQRPFFRTYSPKEKAYVADKLSPDVRSLFDACGVDGSDIKRG